MRVDVALEKKGLWICEGNGHSGDFFICFSRRHRRRRCLHFHLSLPLNHLPCFCDFGHFYASVGLKHAGGYEGLGHCQSSWVLGNSGPSPIQRSLIFTVRLESHLYCCRLW